MNRLLRFALLSAIKLALASLTVAQVPVARPVDAVALFGHPAAGDNLSPPVGHNAGELTIVLSVGRCGYVDEGQAPIRKADEQFVPFYAFAYKHFGARHDLRAVPFLTFDAAKAAVIRECK
jgi:hypothetical protein